MNIYLQKEDNLKITILSSEYNTKILQNGEETFADKYLFPYEVKVVGIEGYFSPSRWEMEKNKYIASNKYWWLAFGILALGAVVLLIFVHRKS